MSKRPFSILGVQQIAIGNTNREALRHLWVDMLGLELSGRFRSKSENVEEDIAAIGRGPLQVEVDLMVPIDPKKRPKVHSPALNHIGLWIDDLEAAVAWLSAAGVRFAPGGIRVGASGHPVCFIHPKGNDDAPTGGEGVLIELVQAPQDVIEGFHKLTYPDE